MTKFSSVLSRLATRFFVRQLVIETISPLVGRALTRVEVEQYALVCKQQGLSHLVSSVVDSDDGFAEMLSRHDGRIADALDQAFEQRSISQPPIEAVDTIEAHRIFVEKIQKRAHSDDHWKNQLSKRTSEVMDAVRKALLSLEGAKYHSQWKPDSTLKSIEDLTAAIATIASSDEHWRKIVETRAENLVAILYRALLTRNPDKQEEAEGVALLHSPGNLERLVTALASSRELRQALLQRYAEFIVRPIATRFLGGAADTATVDLLCQKLESTGDLAELLTALTSLQAYERVSLSAFVPTLLTQLFLRLLHRGPTEIELREIGATLQSATHFGEAISRILAAIQTTTLEPPNLSFFPDETLSAIEDLEWTAGNKNIHLAHGFYENEGIFSWSEIRSKIIVRGSRKIYLACNYLQPQETRVVSIFDGERTQTVTIENPFGCHEVEFDGTHARVVSFCADGAYKPSSSELSDDDRDLAFQLYEQIPADKYISQQTPQESPILLFVSDEKKEIDSIRPVYEQLRLKNFLVQFLDVDMAIEYTKCNYSSVCGYVISSASTYTRLFNAGCRSSFIYLEHGVSPVKKYTYGSHYRRYDLALLPGSVWTERVETLYPEMRGRCKNVGYAKLRPLETLNHELRLAQCAELGLDPSKPIILFAPTWSGGDEDCGIFNLKYFDLDENLITAPHDGDVEFCTSFSEKGYKIAWPKQGVSISTYYNLADILISDISSTAIEFAFLGKPVICLMLDKIQDFDMRNVEKGGKLRIPHTNHYWDFCEWSSPHNLTTTIARIKTDGLAEHLLRMRKQSVFQLVSCCGDESIQRSATAIEDFFKSKQKSYYPRATREHVE